MSRLIRTPTWVSVSPVTSETLKRLGFPPAAEATRYGLYDLDRLERMILRRIASHYFLLDGETHD